MHARLIRERGWRGLAALLLSNAAAWTLLLGAGFAVVTAYLVVAGRWHIALGLIVAMPGLILLHRYPFVTVLVWLALAQFLMTTGSSAERTVYWVIHRALPPATVGIIVVSSWLRINPRPLPRLGVPELAMAGYLAASLISVITLNDSPLATAYLLYDRVFSPICLYLIARLSLADEADLRRLVAVACVIALSQSAIGLISWVAPQVLPSDWLGQVGQRTVGSLVNSSTYTAALAFSGLLVLQAGLSRPPGLVRTVYLVACGLSFFCIFLSFSRASWLGGVLIVLGLVRLYPAFVARMGLVALVAGALSGGLLAEQLRWASERLYSEESERSALSRLPVYLAAYRMFEARPLFGWGYNNFDRYDRAFQGRVGNFENDNKDHASHNFFLSLIAEQGLVGIGLFLGPFLWWLLFSWKQLPAMPDTGLWSGKLLILLWLIILYITVLNNFSNMRVVFGLGLRWLTLGLIASMVCACGAQGKELFVSVSGAKRQKPKQKGYTTTVRSA